MIKEKVIQHIEVERQFVINRITNPGIAKVSDIQIVNKRLFDIKCSDEVCFTKREVDFVLNHLELFI